MKRTWHKHYAPGVPPAIPFEKTILPEMLSDAVRDFPDKEAIIFYDSPIRFFELEKLVNRTANALLDLGIKRGDKIALLLPNMPQIVIAAFAAWKTGAVVVMTNLLNTDRELEHQLSDSGSEVLVALDLLCPRMIALKEKTHIRTIIVVHARDHILNPTGRELHLDIEPAEGIHQWKDLIDTYPDTAPGVRIDLEDLACLQYTGGTTGISKAAVLTHTNLSWNVQQTRAWFHSIVRGRGALLAVLPYFHSFGMLAGMNISILLAQTQVLIPQPDLDTILNSIQKYKITLFPGVPTLYTAILSHPKISEYDLSTLEVCISGGAPLPVDLIDSFERLTSVRICEAYGLTEAGPLVSVNPFGGKTKHGSVGVPIPDTDVRIVNVDSAVSLCAPGEEGEITVKGPQIMQGYYRMPKETAQTLKNGWLHTGDIGRMDEEGYLYIVDRKKDMIIAGGYNIYPNEIDQVLFEHPKILEACTIGVPDPYRGETVKSFIVVNPGEELSEDEVIDYCREKLAKYKVPRMIELTGSLPKSGPGKILRKELKRI